jgi:hypothetical protein
MLAGVGERDRATRHPPGAVVNQNRSRLSGRLHAGGGVHRVARHHAFADRPDGDRDLASHDAGARGQPRGADLRPQLADSLDQVESRADRALRITLGRGRRSPDRHDRVADELLDDPAVPPYDSASRIEVTGQQLPHLFGIARLG